MSLKYMQYMPFFSSPKIRGFSLYYDASEISDIYGVKIFPYITYPSYYKDYATNTETPVDKSVSIIRYLFCGRYPAFETYYNDYYNDTETGPNMYRLENLMYILDNLCIQHKWRLGEPDKGFIWKIPTNDGYEEFTPQFTPLVYAVRSYIDSKFKTIYDRTVSFIMPVSDLIDMAGGPVIIGLETWNPSFGTRPPIFIKHVPNFSYYTSPRDYSWIYMPNTGNLHGITFDNLYIYQQLKETLEIIGRNLFIDIPGKNYNVDIPLNFCNRVSLHPIRNAAEYESADYIVFRNVDINVKKLRSVWEIPEKLAGIDIYENLDEKPGWLPLGVDINSICDYGKLKSFVTEDETIIENWKKTIAGQDGYIWTYNRDINGQSSLSNYYNAMKLLQYNYFNQFFLPLSYIESTYVSKTYDDDLIELYDKQAINPRQTASTNQFSPYVPTLFNEIVFGGIAISAKFVNYSDAVSSNDNEFDLLKNQIENMGLKPAYKYHYTNSNVTTPDAVAISSITTRILANTDALVEKDGIYGYYIDGITDATVSAMSYAVDNVYRDVSDDIEVESVPNNGGFNYFQKYTSPKRLLHHSKFNNGTAYENAQKNLLYHFSDLDTDRRLLNLTAGHATYRSAGFNQIVKSIVHFNCPIDNKTFAAQYRLLHRSMKVSCTYVGNKTLRNKIGIRNRLTSISKIYAPYIAAGIYPSLAFLFPNNINNGAVNPNPIVTKGMLNPLEWEKSVGIVQSTDTSVGPATTNFDNNKVKYYYGWVQFPDNILSKENFDMMSMNNYIRLCQHIRDSNPQKTLLFEVPGNDGWSMRLNGGWAKTGRKTVSAGIDNFIKREAYCDFDSFLDAEPPFDNAVLFLWCETDNPYPTYAKGHISGGSLEEHCSGINIVENTYVSSAGASIVNGQVVHSDEDFVFYDDNQNLAATNTQYNSEKIASFYVMSHNVSSADLNINNIYVNKDEFILKLSELSH
jgi:hypothetical protein